MTTNNPWRKEPQKRVESRSEPGSTYRFNRPYKQALEEMAESESDRFKEFISRSTVLINLSTRNGKYFTQKRKELAQRYKQLKRESTT